ncbi:hypothetical protein B0H13DRAFT_1854652 [Mycena leptocephala]|nr:hypothetical protein B0H13DRAFT_1854652 [Mycena leptocephala]
MTSSSNGVDWRFFHIFSDFFGLFSIFWETGFQVSKRDLPSGIYQIPMLPNWAGFGCPQLYHLGNYGLQALRASLSYPLLPAPRGRRIQQSAVCFCCGASCTGASRPGMLAAGLKLRHDGSDPNWDFVHLIHCSKEAFRNLKRGWKRYQTPELVAKKASTDHRLKRKEEKSIQSKKNAVEIAQDFRGISMIRLANLLRIVLACCGKCTGKLDVPACRVT